MKLMGVATLSMLIVGTSVCAAAPLSINEATFPGAGGDYNNLLSPPRAPGLAEVFRPEAGVNTFTGSIFTGGPGSDQGDTWLLQLDPGRLITRIRVSFGTNQDIAINQGSLFTLETSGPVPTVYLVNLNGRNPLPLLTDSGPLTIGSGIYSATILTGVLASSSNGPVGYQVSFDVTDSRVVPLPPSAVLLVAGLLGLAGAASRRRSDR